MIRTEEVLLIPCSPSKTRLFRSSLLAVVFSFVFSVSASSADQTAPRSGIDFSHPILFENEPVTAGFEAEFNGLRAERIINPATKLPYTDRFPYLANERDKELTGNTEVRSVGGEWKLNEVFTQMEEMKSLLDTDLRGFHFHIRVPHSAVVKIDPVLFRGWIAVLGDAVTFWRLENRPPFFALKTQTVGRVNPNELEERATIRVNESEDYYDIEIRGYMKEIGKVRELAKTLLAGIQNPSLIPASARVYGITSIPYRNYIEAAGAGLDEDAKAHLKMITDRSPENWNPLLPFYAFESSRIFSPEERLQIEASKKVLFHQIADLSRASVSRNGFEYLDYEISVFNVIQEWAKKIGFEKKLLAGSFVKSRVSSGESTEEWDDFFRLWKLTAGKGEVVLITRAMSLLGGAPDDRALPLIEAYSAAPSARVRRMAILQLKGRVGPRVDLLIEKAFLDTEKGVRRNAVEALVGRTDAESRRLLMSQFSVNDRDLQSRILKALGKRNDPESKAAVIALLADEKYGFRDAAIEELATWTDSKSLQALIHAGEAPRYYFATRRAFLKRPEVEVVPYIERWYARETDAEMKKEIRTALAAREDEGSHSLLRRILNEVPEAEKIRIENLRKDFAKRATLKKKGTLSICSDLLQKAE